MEKATMSSDNSRFITHYTLLERLRDAEYPDILYATDGENMTGKYWCDDLDLQYEGERTKYVDSPYQAFLADFVDPTIDLELNDSR